MHGHSMRENREILCSPDEGGRDASGRLEGRTPMMNGQRRSDRLVVPTKLPNKARYGCGGGGGKESGQGEGGRAKHAPDPESDKAC